MPNLYIISYTDSDDSDSEYENSDYEQDEDVNMTQNQYPKQAMCKIPLKLFKIEQINPITVSNTPTKST